MQASCTWCLVALRGKDSSLQWRAVSCAVCMVVGVSYTTYNNTELFQKPKEPQQGRKCRNSQTALPPASLKCADVNYLSSTV